MFCSSCSECNELNTLDEESKNERFEIIESKNMLVFLEETNLLSQSAVIEELSPTKMFSVSDDLLRNDYKIIQLSSNLNLPSEYIEKTCLIYYDLNHLKKNIAISFIIRFVESNRSIKKKFLEILNPLTGEIIYSKRTNISDEEYSSLKGYDLKLNSKNTFFQRNTICFQKFDTCVDFMNGGDNPGDDVICEWVPCTTFAYVACFILGEEGQIDEGYDCFIGCAACDVYIDA